MRIAEMTIPAHPVMKTFQAAPTTPDVGLLTEAGSVESSTEGLGLQPGVYSNESLLIGRAQDSADVRQS